MFFGRKQAPFSFFNSWQFAPSFPPSFFIGPYNLTPDMMGSLMKSTNLGSILNLPLISTPSPSGSAVETLTKFTGSLFHPSSPSSPPSPFLGPGFNFTPGLFGSLMKSTDLGSLNLPVKSTQSSSGASEENLFKKLLEAEIKKRG